MFQDTSSDSNETSQAGEAAVSLKPYTVLLKFSFFNATTWLIALGTPLVLLASQLGATSFEVGLMYSFVFLLLPIQIVATALLPLLGYKRQIILAWTARGFSLFIPLWLVTLSPQDPPRWMAMALVFSAFMFAFFRSFGSCALPPMLYSLLPDNVRGRYFSTEQAIAGLAGILTLILFSLLFRFVEVYTAFLWQYAYAILAVGFTVFYLSKVEDPPRPASTSIRAILYETPAISLQRSPFRQYLIFMLTAAIMSTSFVPLMAYYLKVEGGLSVDRILFYTAIQYSGAILATIIIRSRIDQIGVKPVFRLSLIIGACVSTYWFFLVTGLFPGLVHGLPVAYFLFGISASQWITAHLKYMPRVCDDSRQALHVSIHSSVVGVIGGVAPMVWGLLVKTPGNTQGVKTDVFALYFFALLASQLLLFVYTPRLTSIHRDRPSLLPTASILRPFRYLSNLVNAVPQRKVDSKVESPD